MVHVLVMKNNSKRQSLTENNLRKPHSELFVNASLKSMPFFISILCIAVSNKTDTIVWHFPEPGWAARISNCDQKIFCSIYVPGRQILKCWDIPASNGWQSNSISHTAHWRCKSLTLVLLGPYIYISMNSQSTLHFFIYIYTVSSMFWKRIM